AALELAAVPLPIGVSQVERGVLPALAAQAGRGVEPALVAYVARQEGEPELGVLLPVPVRGKLRQAAEARRASAQHVLGRARARRASGGVALATRNGFPCAGRAPAASCHGFPLPRQEIYWSFTPSSSPARGRTSRKVSDRVRIRIRDSSPGAFAGEKVKAAGHDDGGAAP